MRIEEIDKFVESISTALYLCESQVDSPFARTRSPANVLASLRFLMLDVSTIIKRASCNIDFLDRIISS